MPDPLPAVAGTVQVDINPNDFAPGTKVDGTTLTAANTTPVLTPNGTNPIYKANVFNGRGSIYCPGGSGFSVPRPVQDDFTIYFVCKDLVGLGNNSANWDGNAALVDASQAFFGNEFGATLRQDGFVTIGIGSTGGDASAISNMGVARYMVPQIFSYTRNKTSGVSRLYLNGTLIATVTGTTASLTSQPNLYFGKGAGPGSVVANYARVVAYDADHNGTDRGLVEANLRALYVDPTQLVSSKIVVYAASGSYVLKSTKQVVYAAIGPVSEGKLKATKIITQLALGTRNLAARKIVVYAALGAVTPPPPAEGGEPDVLPPENCSDSSTNNPNCCVPDLNRVIEARVGPLNTHHDLVVAIQYLQDRHNVLVREFNKLALVTRSNPPSV